MKEKTIIVVKIYKGMYELLLNLGEFSVLKLSKVKVFSSTRIKVYIIYKRKFVNADFVYYTAINNHRK